MKRSQPKRAWEAARAKVEDEARCRLWRDPAGCDRPLEAAHVVGREHDPAYGSPRGSGWLYVRPESVIPLCRRHHKLFDEHAIDVLQVLELEEQLCAVQDLGGIENARIRTCPSQYGKAAA